MLSQAFRRRGQIEEVRGGGGARPQQWLLPHSECHGAVLDGDVLAFGDLIL